MRYQPKLQPANFLRRYKRFLCDAALANGRNITAHCPNPGSMLSLLPEQGSLIWLSYSDNPKRKLAYGWELVCLPGTLVGINAGLANRLLLEALAEGRIPELADYPDQRREVPYGAASRIDFLLSAPARPPCYLEVKSVTMSRRDGLAEFPDSVTARGAKHLKELAAVARGGARAVLFFLVQRADCGSISVAADIDPVYAQAYEDALRAGVEVISYCCKVTPETLELDRRI